MAVYVCPRPTGCGRRVRGVVPKGGDGSAEVYVRHNKTRHSNVLCPNSRTVIPDDNPPVEARKRPGLTEEAEVQLSGVLAWFDGECVYACGEPILNREHTIIKRGNGWAHVTCHRKAHE